MNNIINVMLACLVGYISHSVGYGVNTFIFYISMILFMIVATWISNIK